MDQHKFLKNIEISDKEFKEIQRLVYDNFGINLTEQKRSLVTGRLQKVIRNLKLNSFGEYLSLVKSDGNGSHISELINKISTNHTFFNRERKHFEILKDKVLPEIIKKLHSKRSKDFRMWCAASSTGEEPYMLLMIQHEVQRSLGLDWEIGLLATDISTEALTTAQKGIYDNERVEAIQKNYLSTYFNKLPDGNYQVIPQLRREILFRRFNLMNSFPFKGKFDIIFARNVMIYFDQKTRANLVRKFYNYLNSGGYLFIGHSETLNRTETDFVSVSPALYRKP